MSMLRRRLMMRTAKPYIELEYIESTGTQYIDTGFYPSPNTIIQMDLKFSGNFSPSNGVGAVLGTRDTNERMSCNFEGMNSQSREMFFWIGLATTPVCSLNWLPVDQRNTLVFQNGKAVYGTHSINVSTFKSESKISLPLVLFGQNINGKIVSFNYYHMIVYCCKLYDGEILMRDFIPVMRKSDCEICLYDKVTQRFFTNQGTGTFSGKIAEDYPYKWDYGMGELRNAGYEELINGTASSTLSDNGLKLSAKTGNSYIRYLFPIIHSSISECEVVFNVESFVPATFNGFRIQLTNAVIGNQIYVKNNALYFGSETAQLKLKDIIAEKDYKIRLWFDETRGCKVWLDDELIYETESFSTQYCTNTAIFQQSGGSTILKSVKYRVIKY
ncbi:MAG: hypothetical protein K2L19_03185 [Eubacterium sp.]|nr:hypothetical protein [Eubacterium sp.]